MPTSDYSLNILPTELLIHILSYLTAKQLINCRQVCLRWKEIVDFLKTKDSLWQDYFTQDYGDKYKISQINTRPGLLCYDIYRSFSLWPKLANALESIDEFAAASHFTNEIKNFKILRNGTIGIHTHSAIIYYDINTWQKSKQNNIFGDFLKYCENDILLVTLNFQLNLCITLKALCTRQCNTIGNIKTFLLIKNQVYYVTLNDEISVWNLESVNNFSTYFLKRFEDGIMSLGYKENRLNVITFQQNIYSLSGHNFNFVSALCSNSNLVQVLREYNFLENFDWRIYFQWMYVLNRNIPEGPLRDIVTVRTYGDVIFIGTNWGVLRIYYAPSSSGELDFFDAEPIKQYNFMEPFGCPVLSVSPIIKIDVLETKEGHTVLVAMPKKIATISFSHKFVI